jgi:hypothetical protein
VHVQHLVQALDLRRVLLHLAAKLPGGEREPGLLQKVLKRLGRIDDDGPPWDTQTKRANAVDRLCGAAGAEVQKALNETLMLMSL